MAASRFKLFMLPVLLTICALAYFVLRWDEGDVRPQAGQVPKRNNVKIGVLFLDKADTPGYSYAHNEGIKKLQENLGLRDDQIIRKFDVNNTDAIMIAHMIRECVANGANIIIATSWGYMDVCEELAKEYPSVVFAHATGYKRNDKNFTNYYGRIYQARYLSGIAAGMKTKTGKIGFVAAMGKQNSEVTGGLNAFALGVESVNPEARVYVNATNNWYDPSGEAAAARKLLEAGCDVIAQHCDTPAPQKEAEKVGAWGIGYNSDMSEEAPGAVLTSVIWHWDIYYMHLVQSVLYGTFSTEPYYGGMQEGMVDITDLNPKLTTPEAQFAVEAAKERIKSGEINVFDGVMETNDGKFVGTEGGTLSDEEITGRIDWYYRTVVELQ